MAFFEQKNGQGHSSNILLQILNNPPSLLSPYRTERIDPPRGLIEIFKYINSDVAVGEKLQHTPSTGFIDKIIIFKKNV